MKNFLKYLVASVVCSIVLLLVLYLQWIGDSRNMNTTLAGLLAAGAFWRTLEFFKIKEAGVPTGLAIAQTIVIFPIDKVREQVKKSKQEKEKKEAIDFVKQLQVKNKKKDDKLARQLQEKKKKEDDEFAKQLLEKRKKEDDEFVKYLFDKHKKV